MVSRNVFDILANKELHFRSPSFMSLNSENISKIGSGNGEVWAIAGGKGGTGKSFISSSLATGLATRGDKVILIDADIGGANLHSLLGIKRPRCTLTDFFDRKIPLEDIVTDTGIENLGLVTGDFDSLDSDDIKHFQKLKLFRHIKSLRTDYVLADLGGGVHKNTIDTFLLAEKKIIVVVPEVTAIENMYHFIKNALFRKLKVAFNELGMENVVQNTWKMRYIYGFKNLRDLIVYLKKISKEVGDVIDREMSSFKIHIILNQVRKSHDISMGASIKNIFKNYLGFDSFYVGYIEYDDCVLQSIKNREPFVYNYPSSRCTAEVKRIIENVIGNRQVKVISA